MLIVDTGVLLAAADAADPDHAACREVLEFEPGPLVTTSLVVAETAYLINRQLGPVAEAAFFRDLADGILGVQEPDSGAWARIAALIEQYADLPLGGTDASLIELVERHAQHRIATLDRRHFGVVQPLTGPIEILPP